MHQLNKLIHRHQVYESFDEVVCPLHPLTADPTNVVRVRGRRL